METPEERLSRELSRMQIGADERARQGRERMAIAAQDAVAFELALVELFRWSVRQGHLRFRSVQMRGFLPPKIVTLGRYPDTRIAAILRHETERGRWIGWSHAIWDRGLFADFGPEPIHMLTILRTFLEEELEAGGYGPPRRFLPGRITWVGFQPMSLEEAALVSSFPLFVPRNPPEAAERSVWVTFGTVGGNRQEAVLIEWRRGDEPVLSLVQGVYPDLWRARASWEPDSGGRNFMVPTENPFGMLVPMVAVTVREGTLIWVDSSLGLDAVDEILQSLERVPGSPAPPPDSAS
jgi:hypothetical protein